MAKNDVIEVDGKVIDVLPGGKFKVELANGHIVEAHVSGDVPNIMLSIENLNEENIGELIYFFEKACAMSGMILGVNPFNQPGVEEYKKNMFKLLKKPGY